MLNKRTLLAMLMAGLSATAGGAFATVTRRKRVKPKVRNAAKETAAAVKRGNRKARNRQHALAGGYGAATQSEMMARYSLEAAR